MFAYCNNNPVNYSDPYGESISGIIVNMLIAGGISATVSSFVTWGTGGTWSEVWDSAMWGFGLGAIGVLGSWGTGVSLGIIGLKTYCESRGNGVSSEGSLLTAGADILLSLPIKSCGTQSEQAFVEITFGIISSLTSYAINTQTQEGSAQTSAVAANNKTTFYHNVSGVTSIGLSMGIMSNSYSVTGGNLYVRI